MQTSCIVKNRHFRIKIDCFKIFVKRILGVKNNLVSHCLFNKTETSRFFLMSFQLNLNVEHNAQTTRTARRFLHTKNKCIKNYHCANGALGINLFFIR